VIKVVLTPFFPVVGGEEWRKEEVTLIGHVSDFSLSYFGAEDAVSESVWRDEWLEKKFQPKLVKIKIALENEIFWPDMIIEIKAVGTNTNADADIQEQQEE
jgi:general secretion pathway protein J